MKSNKLLTGILTAIVMLAIVPASSAFAQEDTSDSPLRHYRPLTIFGGIGAAVNDDDRGFRSHFRLAMTSDDDTFEVKRGIFVLKHDSVRKIAHVVPDSWTVELSDDEILRASGDLESADGRVFTAKLEGEKIADLANGALFFVKGKITDGETTLDLYYLSALHTKEHRISPAAAAAS